MTYVRNKPSVTTADRAKAIRALCECVVEAVKAGGGIGVPGGTIYAALMTQGCTLQQFESLMDALVRNGNLTKRGQRYVFERDLMIAAPSATYVRQQAHV